MQPRLMSVVNRQGVKDTRLDGEVAPEFSTYRVFPPYKETKARLAQYPLKLRQTASRPINTQTALRWLNGSKKRSRLQENDLGIEARSSRVVGGLRRRKD
jgi:hypothetical protein